MPSQAPQKLTVETLCALVKTDDLKSIQQAFSSLNNVFQRKP